ncbi:MAG: phosphoribosylanthranilate isomerase [Gammaproteobacteria bacterium]|nr:phosphoribosylanthranilate isomerase [Gammaproteobacteria bacterium]MBU6509569.1 phosphoribosylanthranilate isomerase [Gammaproteobacteria bacterium]MDE1983426.1 phosphoribosylanthranilate isomerase [Gammaproteobacteria bacterium]MDE2107937.1 phosphoribosylanthranilate isomerase [Gammaproteobacteria bacterium]
MRVRIKLCGMMRREDVALASQLGADAVGLVFYAASPRCLSLAQARDLAASAPALLTMTAVFMNPARADVEQVLHSMRIDVLQFHGEESPEFCRAFGRAYVKAVPMGGGADASDYARRYADACALLLDSHAHGQPGGQGARFAWNRVPPIAWPPLILAGGLNAENVADAIRSVHPYGVDVSSGVESAPGIKDQRKMSEFVREVQRVSTA